MAPFDVCSFRTFTENVQMGFGGGPALHRLNQVLDPLDRVQPADEPDLERLDRTAAVGGYLVERRHIHGVGNHDHALSGDVRPFAGHPPG
jgi:hypothetical protein